MKANELRVGNYLTNYKGEICQIKYFHSGETYSDGKKDNHGSCLYSIDRSNPIPITEEWLLKFELRDDFGLFSFNWIDINVSIHQSYNVWRLTFEKANRQMKIKYVHQLQNIYFALTGQEL